MLVLLIWHQRTQLEYDKLIDLILVTYTSTSAHVHVSEIIVLVVIHGLWLVKQNPITMQISNDN